MKAKHSPISAATRRISFVKCGLGLAILGFLAAHLSCAASNDYKNASLPIEKRVESLLSQMTIEEKVFQLSQTATGNDTNVNNVVEKTTQFDPRLGSTIFPIEDPKIRNAYQRQAMTQSRLGIPIIFGYDVIHGYKTIFPVPLAQACSWNPDLVRDGCAVAAAECKSAGIDWTFSPMIDVARDPRWGRVVEGYGEDAYVNGVFAAAAVKGYQGETIPYKVIACLKHFVGYGESEGGRDYAYTNISDQALWETYLPPYETGVKAGARTLMAAFNDINGIPASANHFTMTEILRGKWGFTGFVVSDWGSVNQLKNQGYVDDNNDVAQKAIEAGLDMEMVDGYYRSHIPHLVKNGTIDIKTVDEAVRRVLRVKFEAGLFENPYVDEKPESERLLKPEYRAKARQMAVESMVLLKNKDNILPLADSVKNIALIGPLIKDKRALIGSWDGRGNPKDTVDIEEGLGAALAETGRTIHYAKGCDINKTTDDDLNAAVDAANKSDVILLCVGENHSMNGENASRSTLSMTKPQLQLIDKLVSLKKPIVLLLAIGRPLSLQDIEPNMSAILVTWHPGTEAGNAVADLVTGKENPSGRLAITFPRTEGQIPIYYCMRNRARPYQGKYQDISTDPMYWFGEGIGYSEFEYGNLALDSREITSSQDLTVSVDVTNKGKFDGKETVFLYIRDHAASVSQPIKRLIAFQKVDIPAGQTQKVEFKVNPQRDLSFVNAKGKRILEPGKFDLMTKDKKEEIMLK